MPKVIPIGNISLLDFDPDRVLNEAIGKLDGVVVIGFDKNGDVYAASSYSDRGDVMWLLEACKTKMFQSIRREDDY